MLNIQHMGADVKSDVRALLFPGDLRLLRTPRFLPRLGHVGEDYGSVRAKRVRKVQPAENGVGVLRADHGVVHLEGRAYLRPRLRQLAAIELFYLPDRGLLSPRFTVRDQLGAVEWRFGTVCEAIANEQFRREYLGPGRPL